MGPRPSSLCPLTFLELAPIGWQLFVLACSANDQAACSASIATFATRLLAQALSFREHPLSEVR